MADGRTIFVEPHELITLEAASRSCGYSRIGMFIDAMAIMAFPQLQSAFTIEDLEFIATARVDNSGQFLSPVDLDLFNRKPSTTSQPKTIELPQTVEQSRVDLKIADSSWQEILRIALLGGYPSRAAFLRDLINRVLPQFNNGVSSVKEIAQVFRATELRRELLRTQCQAVFASTTDPLGLSPVAIAN